MIKITEDYSRTSRHKPHSFTCRDSPQTRLRSLLPALSLSPSRSLALSFSLFRFYPSIPKYAFLSTYPLFAFTSTDFLPSRFILPRRFLFTIDNLPSLAKYTVERDRVSNQEITLVSSKLNAPEKIEVALIKKKEEKRRIKALGATGGVRLPAVAFVLVILIRFLCSLLGNGQRIKIPFDEIFLKDVDVSRAHAFERILQIAQRVVYILLFFCIFADQFLWIT